MRSGLLCGRLTSVEVIYDYCEHPEMHEQWTWERVEKVERRCRDITAMEHKPDFICVGDSGILVFQSLDIFNQLSFPAVKRGIELATEMGIPFTFTHADRKRPALTVNIKLFHFLIFMDKEISNVNFYPDN